MSKNTHLRWLSPEVLEWQPLVEDGWSPEEDLRLRSYEMLAHADHLLTGPTPKMSRIDIVATLRRAIDRRVRALNSVYSLRAIPLRDKPSDPLLLLESLGVVRSHMVQKLIKIRNAVEHEDVAPPDHETCKVFTEFTWYFLRSTDRMLQEVTKSFYLEPPGEDANYYGLQVKYGPTNNWTVKVWGWIKPELMLDRASTDWLSFQLSEIESRKQLRERLKGSPGAVKPNEHGRGKKLSDLCVRGEVRGPGTAIARITQLYFSVV